MTENTYHYREHKGAPGAPLLLLFHGTGGDENQFYQLGEQLVPSARLVAVRGDVSEGGMLRYFRRTGEGVYDMLDLGRRTNALLGFVSARIAEDRPSAVLALGYSNGANIIASMTFDAGSPIDAAVLLHPLIPFEPVPNPGLAGRRILITAGRRDPICPPPATENLSRYYSDQGAETEIVWHPGGHEIRQEELAAAAAFLGQYRT